MADERKIRIAVVDHDAVFLALVRKILESDGYEVVICPDSTSAHEMISSGQPAMVLLDTWLEHRESGWTLLQTLRLDEKTQGIPVLLSTSDPDAVRERARQVEQLGNIVILAKPFDPESLLQRVRETLSAGGERPTQGFSADVDQPASERSRQEATER